MGHAIQIRYCGVYSELTFATTSRKVTSGQGKELACEGVSPVKTIPETIEERISFSVAFSFLKWRNEIM